MISTLWNKGVHPIVYRQTQCIIHHRITIMRGSNLLSILGWQYRIQKALLKGSSQNQCHQILQSEYMPTKSNKNGALKKGLTLPPGSLALTLIAAEDWDNSPKLLKSIYKQSSSLQRGLYLSCCERFGGNSLSRKSFKIFFPITI